MKFVIDFQVNPKPPVNMEPDLRTVYKTTYQVQKPYGFWAFMGDLFMITITGGLWLIWIFVREMRRR